MTDRSRTLVTIVLAVAVASLLPAIAATSASTGPTITCSSEAGHVTHCPADTSAGVALVATTGTAHCLLGKTWGYDDASVWVSDGCSGEFALGKAVPEAPASPAGTTQPAAPPANRLPTPRVETWGEFDPGDGFLVGRNSAGELDISGYALVRYIDQTPAEQTYIDHLGNARQTDGRNDIFSHRIMLFFKGWVGSPKMIYNVILWTVNATDQKNVFVAMGYQFSRKFSLYGGLNGMPGTRSLQGSHPFWLGNDRVMADEFFRPYFSNGLWAQGEATPGFWYNAMIANNLSALGIKATQLDRKFSYGASVWWMPTTKEFGPRGGYGDWENHEKVATRFGISGTYSPEQSFADGSGIPGNTTIRLADSLNVFDPGALAPDVTVQNVDYRLLAVDAGLKYRGFFLLTELYWRRLDNFDADGALPVRKIEDKGFYVQAAFYPVPKTLELYAATSQIYGDKDAGFENSSEYLVGLNFYPFDSRNYRLNAQVIDVNRSPVNSTFGYYTGGQDGRTVAAAFSIFF